FLHFVPGFVVDEVGDGNDGTPVKADSAPYQGIERRRLRLIAVKHRRRFRDHRPRFKAAEQACGVGFGYVEVAGDLLDAPGLLRARLQQQQALPLGYGIEILKQESFDIFGNTVFGHETVPPVSLSAMGLLYGINKSAARKSGTLYAEFSLRRAVL